MLALMVIDVQNEFSENGRATAHDHAGTLDVIRQRVEEARTQAWPIAWIRHYNRPDEPERFIPGTWGAGLSPDLGPVAGTNEREFTKDVYGAFTGSNVGSWLRERGVDGVVLAGFFTHMCVSTTAREALMNGFKVAVDPDATSAHDLEHPLLGQLPASDVKRSALLQLADMGVVIARRGVAQEPQTLIARAQPR